VGCVIAVTGCGPGSDGPPQADRPEEQTLLAELQRVLGADRAIAEVDMTPLDETGRRLVTVTWALRPGYYAGRHARADVRAILSAVARSRLSAGRVVLWGTAESGGRREAVVSLQYDLHRLGVSDWATVDPAGIYDLAATRDVHSAFAGE